MLLGPNFDRRLPGCVVRPATDRLRDPPGACKGERATDRESGCADKGRDLVNSPNAEAFLFDGRHCSMWPVLSIVAAKVRSFC